MFSSDRGVIEIRNSHALDQQALDIVLRLRRSSRSRSHICGWLGQQSRSKQSKKSTQSVFFFFFSFFPHRDLQHSLRKDSFGTNPNGSFLDPDLGTNWTNSDEILVGLATVNSFDPNSKTGPSVSLTD